MMPEKVFNVHVHYGCTEDQSLAGVFKRYVERLVEQCKMVNIARVCLLGSRGEGNKLVQKAFERYPELIVGLGYIKLDEDAPATISDLANKGFRGIKLMSPNKNYDDQSYFPFYERAETLGMPILFHTGVLGGEVDFLLSFPEKVVPERRVSTEMSSARMQPIYLDTIARAFPHLRIIGAHLGWPSYDIACAIARWRPYLYFDISGGSVIRRHIVEGGYIRKEIHVNKLVFGSDCPIERIAQEVRVWQQELTNMGLSADERARIMYRNAAEIFKTE